MMANKKEILRNFDLNGVGVEGSLFGLPYDEASADIVVLPMPWEVTVSYNAGTADGPQAIFDASSQIDYCIPDINDPWTLGIYMPSSSEIFRAKSDDLRTEAQEYIDWLESGKKGVYSSEKALLDKINVASEEMNKWVKHQSMTQLSSGKVVILLGGDHSTPLGLMEALATSQEFGILQIDAHCDLREAYEGFEYSHASIMRNAMHIPEVKKLVQVGIRDYCPEEEQCILDSNGRIETYFDTTIKGRLFSGTSWKEVCDEIVSKLPDNVYICFDIDGLNPSLCPNTGTPVPGGLSFEEAIYLIKTVVVSGRKIIGCDLCEVAPDKDEKTEWDANVGARILYHLCCYTGVSQGKLKLA